MEIIWGRIVFNSVTPQGIVWATQKHENRGKQVKRKVSPEKAWRTRACKKAKEGEDSGEQGV